MAVIPTIYLLWIIFPSSSLEQKKYELVKYVVNILQHFFSSQLTLEISLTPSAEYNRPIRNFKMLRTNIDYSDFVSNLIEVLNEKQSWPFVAKDNVSSFVIELPDNIMNAKQQNFLALLQSPTHSAGAIQKFTAIFETRNKTQTLNSGTKFFALIIGYVQGSFEQFSTAILKGIWDKYRIYDSVVAFTTTNVLSGEPTVKMYTWFPQQTKITCVQFSKVVQIRKEHISKLDSIFNDKMPHDLQGCPLTISCIFREPYIVSDDHKDEWFNTVEASFLGMVLESMNATPKYRKSHFEKKVYVGFKKVIDDLIFNRADLGAGYLPFYYKMSAHVTYLTPHTRFRETWFVPCGKSFSRVKTLLRIFSTGVWCSILLSFVTAVILTRVIAVFSKHHQVSEPNSYMTVSGSTFSFWAVILGVSVPDLPRTLKLRMFFSLFVWYSFAVSTVFQTYFTSFLVNPGQESQISGFDELLRSGIELGSDPLFNYFITNSAEEEHREVYGRRINCTDRHYCFERVHNHGDLAYLDLEAFARMYAALHNNPRICKIDDGGFYSPVTIYIQKGHVLTGRFNKVIMAFIEAGFASKKQRDYDTSLFSVTDHAWVPKQTNVTAISPKKVKSVEYEYTPLTHSHLEVAIYILLLGFVVSLVAFIGEIVYSIAHGL